MIAWMSRSYQNLVKEFYDNTIITKREYKEDKENRYDRFLCLMPYIHINFYQKDTLFECIYYFRIDI